MSDTVTKWACPCCDAATDSCEGLLPGAPYRRCRAGCGVRRYGAGGNCALHMGEICPRCAQPAAATRDGLPVCANPRCDGRGWAIRHLRTPASAPKCLFCKRRPAATDAVVCTSCARIHERTRAIGEAWMVAPTDEGLRRMALDALLSTLPSRGRDAGIVAVPCVHVSTGQRMFCGCSEVC